MNRLTETIRLQKQQVQWQQAGLGSDQVCHYKQVSQRSQVRLNGEQFMISAEQLSHMSLPPPQVNVLPWNLQNCERVRIGAAPVSEDGDDPNLQLQMNKYHIWNTKTDPHWNQSRKSTTN